MIDGKNSSSSYARKLLVLLLTIASKADANEFDHQLEGSELATIQKKAIRGNADASLRIAVHYYSQNALSDGDFWMRLSSEQGSCEGHLHYAEALIHEQKDLKRARLVFEKIRSEACHEFAVANYEYVSGLAKTLNIEMRAK